MTFVGWGMRKRGLAAHSPGQPVLISLALSAQDFALRVHQFVQYGKR